VVAALSWQVAIVGTLALFLFPLAVVYPRQILVASVFTYGAIYRGAVLTFRLNLGPIPVTFLDAGTALLALSSAILVIRKGWPSQTKFALLLVVVAVFAGLVGILHGHNPYSLLQDARTFLFPVIFFIGAATVAGEPRTQRWLLIALLGGVGAAGTFQILDSIWIYAVGQSLPAAFGVEPGGSLIRYGPLSQTDIFRDNLLEPQRVLLLLGVALAHMTSQRVSGWAWAATVLSGVTVVVSLQRSTWIAAAIVLSLVIIRPRVAARPFKIIAVAGTLGASVALLTVLPAFSVTVGSRFQELINPNSTLAVAARQTETASVLGSISLGSAIVGDGLGSEVLWVDPIDGQLVQATNTHNQFLYFIWKSGVIGLFAVLLLYWPISAAWRSHDPTAYGLMAGVGGLLVLSTVGGGISDYVISSLMVTASVIAVERAGVKVEQIQSANLNNRPGH
jgi:hypothetical protein